MQELIHLSMPTLMRSRIHQLLDAPASTYADATSDSYLECSSYQLPRYNDLLDKIGTIQDKIKIDRPYEDSLDTPFEGKVEDKVVFEEGYTVKATFEEAFHRYAHIKMSPSDLEWARDKIKLERNPTSLLNYFFARFLKGPCELIKLLAKNAPEHTHFYHVIFSKHQLGQLQFVGTGNEKDRKMKINRYLLSKFFPDFYLIYQGVLGEKRVGSLSNQNVNDANNNWGESALADWFFNPEFLAALQKKIREDGALKKYMAAIDKPAISDVKFLVEKAVKDAVFKSKLEEKQIKGKMICILGFYCKVAKAREENFLAQATWKKSQVNLQPTIESELTKKVIDHLK